MRPNIENDEGFSVCVLIYGDYPALARRCLDSIFAGLSPEHVRDMRIGLNAASDRVRDYVFKILRNSHFKFPKLVYEPADRANVLKYPLMRRMFHDNDRPIEASHIMWFDDDSCLVGHRHSWWQRVWESVHVAHMLGHLWVSPFQGKMREGIQAQSWYTGKPWEKYRGRDIMRFATGGWWAARTQTIHVYNYPWPELTHNGGDCTLGEMCRQQSLILHSFRDGLWINADEKGKQSGAKRRGVTQRPLWYDYRPDQQPDFSHHEFDLNVFEL